MTRAEQQQVKRNRLAAEPFEALPMTVQHMAALVEYSIGCSVIDAFVVAEDLAAGLFVPGFGGFMQRIRHPRTHRRLMLEERIDDTRPKN